MKPPNRSPRGLSILGIVLFVALVGSPSGTSAQIIRPAPHDGYWLGFSPFYDGDFRTAGQVFQDAAKNGIVNLSTTTGGPWIDAICYHAMLGECHYQMGNSGQALSEYSAALKLFLAHRDWMLRVEFPAGIEPEQNMITAVTWGKTARATTIGHFPPRFSSLQGNLNHAGAIINGGVVAPPSFSPVYAAEIVRCTALALARRRELMGPICEHDPLTAQLVDALARRPGPPNHWSQCWIELQLGLAYAAANRLPQAVSELQKSLLAAGRFDHPLTCVGLLELGRLAFHEGKYEAAGNYFHEATISGAYFERYDVLEEAFRLGSEAFLLSGRKGPYAPLAPAVVAHPQVRMLKTSLLISLAEQHLAVGDATSAAGAMLQARASLARQEMAQGAIGCRMNYQAARLALRGGDLRGGNAALTTALAYQKNASHRLFQIGLADTYFRSGSLTERLADVVFGRVLREPTPMDWATNPLDTLTTLATPHPLPYEHWFELALLRKDHEKALHLADRIRRHRFFTTQALGGRLLALRWVLEGPQEALHPEALLQRQDLLLKFPAFANLSRHSAEVRSRLEALPLAPAEESQVKEQRELLSELAKTSAAQEALLQTIALERLPSDLAFPPLLETKEIQDRLPAGTIVFDYLVTSRDVHAFALGKDKLGKETYASFAVAQPAKVKADIVELLKLMGHFDRTQPVAIDAAKASEWRTVAERLLGQLTGHAEAEEWARYDELVIVPDGVLWYLPFEALPSPADRGKSPLIGQLPIRYAPTLSLTIPDRRQTRPLPRTAIVAGKLLPRDEESVARVAAEAIAGAVTGSTVFVKEPPAASSLFTTALDRLVVLADEDEADKLPFGWSPLALDAARPASTLADWMQLPLAGVDQVILPGFHTPAETSLKRGGTGDEVFLTACGLMASGCRTVLLSRWRVGGQSTIDLMREFIQELPHESAPRAWRRSVQLASDRLVDPAREGRLKATQAMDGLKANHPFFWSGYLLIDTGVRPEDAKNEKDQQAAGNAP